MVRGLRRAAEAGSNDVKTRGGKKIAMIGSRGLPARYGGVETVVDVLARELARRGHRVTVFCRARDYEERPASVDGVRLVYLWSPKAAGFAAIVNAALATVWAVPRRFDVIHYHALGPGLLAGAARLFTAARVVQTVHGRDDRRAKWGRIPRMILRYGAISSAHIPHRTLVVSEALAAEYEDEFQRATTVVPNATGPALKAEPGSALTDRGLERGRYVVSIGRLVPEKAPHELVEAICHSTIDCTVLMIGGSAGTDEYVDEMKETVGADPRVMFTGPVYGTELAQLLTGAAAFITASHLEGLPTALIEAGRTATPCLASDIAPHVEVLGADQPGRRLFRTGDQQELTAKLSEMLADPQRELDGAARLATELDRRFSVTEAADTHERAYGWEPTRTDGVVIDLRTGAEIPEIAGQGIDGPLDSSHRGAG